MVRHDRQAQVAKQQNPVFPNITLHNRTHQNRHSRRTLAHWGWLGGLLVLGLAWQGIAAIAASADPVDPSAASNSSPPATVAAKADRSITETAPSPQLADGVYLYGESPEPEQIGRAYLVLEVTQGNVIGAFYMPFSEFDCTYGRFQADQLALTVIDSYEQGRHPYAIALTPASPIAAQPDQATGLNLEGFYPIATVSENDQRLLNTCKERYPISERKP